jgi:catechol-2,3-dioxygenase
MSKLFKRIDTVFLKVRDFDKAIQWYGEVLGLEVRWRHDEGGYAALNVGETPLTLVRMSPNDEAAQDGRISFNFYVPDIHQAHQHLKDHGVDVGEIVDYGDVLSFNFSDLDGNQLGVCYFAE